MRAMRVCSMQLSHVVFGYILLGCGLYPKGYGPIPLGRDLRLLRSVSSLPFGAACTPTPSHATHREGHCLTLCYAWAVKLMVNVTLLSTMAIFAKSGGVMPKSVMKMSVVAVPVTVVPETFPYTVNVSALVTP